MKILIFCLVANLISMTHIVGQRKVQMNDVIYRIIYREKQQDVRASSMFIDTIYLDGYLTRALLTEDSSKKRMFTAVFTFDAPQNPIKVLTEDGHGIRHHQVIDDVAINYLPSNTMIRFGWGNNVCIGDTILKTKEYVTTKMAALTVIHLFNYSILKDKNLPYGSKDNFELKESYFGFDFIWDKKFSSRKKSFECRQTVYGFTPTVGEMKMD